MLGTYQQAIFAVPENPVMRAVAGAPILMAPTQQKGVTGFGRLGCGGGCQSKISPFGMGNVGDEGLRLYGDWYGAQQTGGMVLNGDRNGLGSYFPSDAHGYRGFSGLGDVGTFITNLTSGNISDALTGNDFFSGIPNWIVVPAGIWFLMSIIEDTKRTYKSVKKSSAKRAAKRKRIESAKRTLAEDSIF